MPELTGVPVSPGWAAGPAYRLTEPPPLPAPRPVTDPEAELARAAAALRAVADDLMRRSEASSDRAAAEILVAQAMIVRDPVLEDSVAAEVKAGRDAAHAITAVLAAYRAGFESSGGYLAERVADLDDLRDRAVAVCTGVAMPGVPAPGVPFVLFARDLAPADTVGLDLTRVLAVVTEEGGPTSHTAILARSLGLPAVVRCPGIRDVADGTLVRVDGAVGAVSVGVDEQTVAATGAQEQARRSALAAPAGPGRTADGHPVALLANIGSARDLADPGVPVAEGVGLFRTELLYLDRTVAPSLEEQIATYAEVFRVAAGRRVVVRTLDAGADKPLPFLAQGREPNPALGVRGLRLSHRDPSMLDAQLTAIAKAAAGMDADVWVMAPMVATVDEASRFVDRCRAAGLARAGVMVEIPAAALRADALLGVVDFLSIGTNDLSQYTFAADRECGELAALLDPWQPALLDLIGACGAAGAAAGKPVGLCGEAGADPLLAPVLVGLGVTSLSMSARALPAVRAALATRTVAECRTLAAAARAAGDPAAARAAVVNG
ncbi:phosphoenolpyruvate--protein phosphotransferase [Rhizomonospora bruguierae]|uniref:phosphoenolpyruvate--protein phosphotransferase n=1 Tax=Rhizomonospora bruguierae TaxID=1581705 RepID=UPI001BCCE527|nr:phosphoenolpyruvate--protein phosphotransferase [Micromonospora sp. NBRC 107566]